MKKEAAEPQVKKPRATRKKNSLNGPGIGGGQQPFFGYPENQGTGWSTQVSQTTTEYKNLRWYLISNMRNLLSEMYVELGLVQTICKVPVEDALRGGVTIKTQQLSEEQIADVSSTMDRENDLNMVGQGQIWSRLYGGGGIMMITDAHPSTKFNKREIKPGSTLDFKAVDMWELFGDRQNLEGSDPVDPLADVEYFNYYGVEVHRSRVMLLKGMEIPSFIRPRMRGWGMSVAEALVRSLNQYLKATDLMFELLDEFKVDIYKIKDYVTTLMSPNGAAVIARRLTEANRNKNYQNALVMDKEDDFITNQPSFAGFGESLREIRMQVASDMRMPFIKLFGQQVGGGLGSTGEDEIEVYNAMVESEVRAKIKYQILRIIELRCLHMYGFIPDDLTIEFKPLRVMSAEQEENVKTQKFSRALQAQQAGLISAEEFRDVCNKGNLFDVTLDDTDLLDDMNATDDISTEGDENLDDSTPKADEPDNYRAQNGELFNFGRRKKNTDGYDKASYMADGGDSWTDDRRKYFYESPQNLSLWRDCKDASKRIYGQENWKFTVWLYDKRGGKFSLGGVTSYSGV